MYIDIVPNRNSPPAVLLRESVREGGFDDEDLDELRRTRNPVAPALASDSARRKKARRTDPDDSAPVAWTTLLSRLATIVRNECAIGADERSRDAIRRETTPTPWQRQAFQLLEAYPWPSMKRTQ